MKKCQRQQLRVVLRRLSALAGVGDASCGVPPAAKEAARLYIQSWLIPQIENVLDADDDAIPERARREAVKMMEDYAYDDHGADTLAHTEAASGVIPAGAYDGGHDGTDADHEAENA